jgi:hypothetical protein
MEDLKPIWTLIDTMEYDDYGVQELCYIRIEHTLTRCTWPLNCGRRYRR